MIVTAEIDIARPAGRKLIREIEKHKSVAKLHYTYAQIENTKNNATTDEVFDMCAAILNEHYGTNLSI